MTVVDDLERALGDVASPDRSIEALLATWRTTPDPDLAQLIVAIAERLPRRRTELRQLKQWRTLLQAEGPARIKLLVDAATVQPWGPSVFRELCALPGDPRIVTLLEIRGAEAPEDARATIDAYVSTHAPRALPEAALARFTAAREAWLATERSLVADVFAAPADDHPRLVYGDWLQEQGDPRGEFIALQFRRHRGRMSDPEKKRENALLDAYAEVWRGGLDRNGVDVSYERGFIERVELKNREVLDVPDWATVRTLEVATYVNAAALVCVPAMTTLRELGTINYKMLLAVGAVAQTLPITRLHVDAYDQVPPAPLVAPSLANVRELVWGYDPAVLVESALLQQIEMLQLHTPVWQARHSLGNILRAGQKLERVILRDRGTRTMELSFTRAESGRFRLDVTCGGTPPQWTPELLQSLPQLESHTFPENLVSLATHLVGS